MIKPTLQVHSVDEISPELLRSRGIRGVMVDLDDTLVAAQADQIEPRFKAWLQTLKDAGFAVMLLSNGSPERVRHWSQELGVNALALVGKPLPWAFRKGLRHCRSWSRRYPPVRCRILGCCGNLKELS
jgi:HAD superfamily phosphatase (TIGR01668 family)